MKSTAAKVVRTTEPTEVVPCVEVISFPIMASDAGDGDEHEVPRAQPPRAVRDGLVEPYTSGHVDPPWFPEWKRGSGGVMILGLRET
jgi:hypothetical protein